jgi:hypothetical protein
MKDETNFALYNQPNFEGSPQISNAIPRISTLAIVSKSSETNEVDLSPFGDTTLVPSKPDSTILGKCSHGDGMGFVKIPRASMHNVHPQSNKRSQQSAAAGTSLSLG